MRLRECLEQGAFRLGAGPHPDRARRDAEALLLHLTGKNRAWMLAHESDDFGGCVAIQYASLLERRLAGEPIQYITGEAEFYGLPFRVTPHVLIPRPETEHLVETVIALCRGMERPRIVDVGTGSGAIAVGLAHELPHAQVTATDLSDAAIEIAQENAARNGLAGRIRLVQGDLLRPFAGQQFDVVASNPPYVSTADRATLAVEVREHEPAMALFAGADGMTMYRRLIPQAAAVLVTGGHIVLEIGYDQKQAIGNLLAESGYQEVEFVPDLQGIARVAIGRRP